MPTGRSSASRGAFSSRIHCGPFPFGGELPLYGTCNSRAFSWTNGSPQKFSADPPIEYDLGSSTGPVWTLRELLALESADERELLDTALSYTSPRGSMELREEIARMQGLDAEHVQIVTGAAEALLSLFYLAAEPGANVVLPDPAFPANTVLADSLGIEVRRYHLRAENGFAIDHDEVRGLVDANTRFLLVNSPHNPTGAVIGEKEMEGLHDFCAERGVGFVSRRGLSSDLSRRRRCGPPRGCRMRPCSAISRRPSA